MNISLLAIDDESNPSETHSFGINTDMVTSWEAGEVEGTTWVTDVMGFQTLLKIDFRDFSHYAMEARPMKSKTVTTNLN